MNHWTIKKQITVGFGALTVVVAAVGLLSLRQFNQVNDELHSMITGSVPATVNILEARGHFEKVVALWEAHLVSTNQAAVEKSLEADLAELSEHMRDYGHTVGRAANQEAWSAFKSALGTLTNEGMALLQLSRAGRKVEANDWRETRLRPAYDQAWIPLAKLIDASDKELEKSAERADAVVLAGGRSASAGVGLALVLAV